MPIPKMVSKKTIVSKAAAKKPAVKKPPTRKKSASLAEPKPEPATTAIHPLDKLRTLAGRQVDEIAELRDSLADELSFGEHERIAKTLIAMTKLVEQLYAPRIEFRERATGDELRQEDDAIAAEFERRLAAMLRGRDFAEAAEDDGAAEELDVPQ